MAARKVGPRVPVALRWVRGALRRLNTYLNARYREGRAARARRGGIGRSAEFQAAATALDRVQPESPGAREYYAEHRERLARTLELVPAARSSGRALELGCYMQITPLLARLRGYRDVRGAHLGPVGNSVWKTVDADGVPFDCRVDCFDVERDAFPYEDESFELVLACELIEHMTADPMHLLIECRRVLEEGARLLVTTPNTASLTSVWRVLHGYDSPQIYGKYTIPEPGRASEAPHVREYTAHELRTAVAAAGFEIEMLATEPIAKFAGHRAMEDFLEDQGFNTALRGEQTYCVAVKRAALAVDRYPEFLYRR